eukprot:6038517-Pyramimonas_sp.AAC.1
MNITYVLASYFAVAATCRGPPQEGLGVQKRTKGAPGGCSGGCRAEATPNSHQRVPVLRTQADAGGHCTDARRGRRADIIVVGLCSGC